MLVRKIAQTVGVQLGFVLLLHASTLVLAQNSVPNVSRKSSVEQTIRRLENERVRALLGGDATFLARNYRDDYITTGANGLMRSILIGGI